MTAIIAFGNLLSRLQVIMDQQGLSVSELVLVLWVLQCFKPGLRSFPARSLAKELVPENVGFNTMKLTPGGVVKRHHGTGAQSVLEQDY